VLAERLFEIDSDTVLEQLATLSGGNSDEERFHLTVAGVDRLLDDFGIALDQRQALVKTWRDEFLGSNRSTREFLIGSGEMFRAGGRALERLFATLISPAGAPQTAPIVRRSMRLATVIGALQESERNGTLTKAVPDLIRSYAHMHVNRMLRAATAPEECLVYDFLVRMYESRLARARNKNGGPSAN